MLWDCLMFILSEILLFYFTDYALAMPIELVLAFYLDENLSDWLIDSGAMKHMCHNKSVFNPGTFKSGTETGVWN